MANKYTGGVSDKTFTVPKTKLVDSKVLDPNAHDHKDSLTPESPYKQTVGGSGKPSGPFGSRGRNF